MIHEATISYIERLARDYAAARRTVTTLAIGLQRELEDVKAKHLDDIKESVAKVADAHASLVHAIEGAPELFVRPRTLTVEGVKFGMQQIKEKIDIADEESVIAKIRAQLPRDQADLLIRRRESVDRNALVDLSEQDLKRLGVQVIAAHDQVVIKSADTDVDKFVNALLREAESIDQDQAA